MLGWTCSGVPLHRDICCRILLLSPAWMSFHCVVACVAMVCWCYWSSSQRGHSNAGWRGSRDAAISTMLQMVDNKEGIANFTLIDTGRGRLYNQTSVLQDILWHIQPAGGMDFRFRPAPPHPKLSSPQIFPQIGTVGSLQINQTTSKKETRRNWNADAPCQTSSP